VTIGWWTGAGERSRAGVAGCLGLASLLLPTRAQASHCTGCETPTPVAVQVLPAAIPPTGPLVITMEQMFAWYDFQIDPTYWDTIQVEVHDGGGTLVEGGLETLEGFSPRLWRPATPLSTGDYTVTARIVPENHCTGYEQEFEVTVQQTVELPAEPEVLITTEARSRADSNFSNYVCCDAAKPYHPDEPGSGCFSQPQSTEWLAGFCTPLTEDHWLRVEASLEAPAAGFFTLRETTTGDRPASGSTAVLLEIDEPGCLEFEIVDLHAGTSSLTSWCPDDAAWLGLLERDSVEGELAANCASPPYVCGEAPSDPCRLWPNGGVVDPCSPDATSGGVQPDTDTESEGPSAPESGDADCTLGRTSRGSSLLTLLAFMACARRRRRA